MAGLLTSKDYFFLGLTATHPAFIAFISPMLGNSTGTILCNLCATSIGKQGDASVGKGAFELHF